MEVSATPETVTQAPQAEVNENENIVEGQDGGQTKSENPSSKEAIKAEIEKRKFKVFGKERELDMTPDNINRYMQKGLAADSVFEEKASLEKKYNMIVQALDDPDSLLELLAQNGMDVDDWAVKRAYAKMQQEEMTPEQRRMMELEKKEKTWQQREQEEQSDRKSVV